MLVTGQEGSTCNKFGIRECHHLGYLQAQVQSVLLFLGCVGGDGTRVSGLGSRRNVGNRVCHEVPTIIVIQYVPHSE